MELRLEKYTRELLDAQDLPPPVTNAHPMNTILRLLAALAVASTGALCAQDTEAPVLTAISIAAPPGGGDVAAGDWTTTVSLTVTDNDTGFANASVTLYRPDGNFVRSTFQAFTPATSGTFDVPITFTVENFGNVALQTLQVTDDLAATFPAPATFSIVAGPASATWSSRRR